MDYHGHTSPVKRATRVDARAEVVFAAMVAVWPKKQIESRPYGLRPIWLAPDRDKRVQVVCVGLAHCN